MSAFVKTVRRVAHMSEFTHFAYLVGVFAFSHEIYAWAAGAAATTVAAVIVSNVLEALGDA